MRVDVSMTVEDVVTIELFPSLFVDNAGNFVQGKHEFSFIRDVLPPQLSIELVSIGLPTSKFLLVGQEEFGFNNDSVLYYHEHSCNNVSRCPNGSMVDTFAVPMAPTTLQEEYSVELNLLGQHTGNMISLHVEENTVFDQYDNFNSNFTIWPVLNLYDWPLGNFSMPTSLREEQFVSIEVSLRYARLADLIFPRLIQFLDLVGDSSALLSSSDLFFHEIAEHYDHRGWILNAKLLHSGIMRNGRRLEESTDDLLTGKEVVSEVKQQLSSNLPRALQLARFVNDTADVEIAGVSSQGFAESDETTQSAPQGSTVASSTIAVTTIALFALIFLVAGFAVYKFREKERTERQKRIDQFRSFSTYPSRFIDDTVMIDEDTGHGTALNEEASDYEEEEDENATSTERGDIMGGSLRSDEASDAANEEQKNQDDHSSLNESPYESYDSVLSMATTRRIIRPTEGQNPGGTWSHGGVAAGSQQDVVRYRQHAPEDDLPGIMNRTAYDSYDSVLDWSPRHGTGENNGSQEDSEQS